MRLLSPLSLPEHVVRRTPRAVVFAVDAWPPVLKPLAELT
jgi:hypothetical protein